MWFLALSVLVPAAAEPDSIAALGRQLFVEKRCTACHAPAAEAELTLHPAARLDDVGSRVRPEWLRGFLTNGHDPDVLASVASAERSEAVENLVHFLASRGGSFDPGKPTDGLLAVIEQGRQLYHSVGCVACHDPFDLVEDLDQPFWAFEGGWVEGAAPLDTGRSSLAHLGDKTSPDVLARFLLDPLHVMPDGRMPSLNLAESEAQSLAAYLCASTVLDGSLELEAAPGLTFDAYHANLDDELATYDALEPVRSGVVADLAELPEHRDDMFGFRFAGLVEIPADGRYSFFTASDDGSRLYLDGKLVVDNGGDHGPVEREGSAELSAGKHSLVVTYYEHGGGEELRVSWSGPGLAKAAIPADALFHWRAPEPAPARATFTPDAARVAAGAELYDRLDCAACHPLEGRSATPRASVAKLDVLAPGSCLDARPSTSPRYMLAEEERAALRTFVRSGKGFAGLSAADRLAHDLSRLDCFACHARDERGGPDAQRFSYFQVRDGLDLGDEGRVPPPLDGVGAKLRHEWLSRVLLESASVRPYMHTRMPSFGAEHVGHLADLFREIDSTPDDLEQPAFVEEHVEAGRKLASVGALGCVQCHDLGHHPSIGIPAVDLTLMYERIKPAWFRKLLLDPKSIGMNSRMPIFWSDGKSPAADIFDADPARQTDALWTWLSLGEAMPLPDGLVVPDETYELTPIERPILCGVFMENVSPRTILVGFPARVHYAFDVQGSRLAKVWRGRFFNARGTWHGRAGQLEKPPTDDVWEAAPGPSVARLPRGDAQWPTDANAQALGRHMSREGVPTFRYKLGETVVEETSRPRVVPGEASLVRRWTLMGPDLGELAIRVAIGDTVTEARDGVWVVDGARLRIAGDVSAQTRRISGGAPSGGSELIVSLPSQESVDVEVEISW